MPSVSRPAWRAVGVQYAHGVVGEDAVGPAAVGDHLGVGRQLRDPLGEFLGRADVEDDDLPSLGAGQ